MTGRSSPTRPGRAPPRRLPKTSQRRRLPCPSLPVDHPDPHLQPIAPVEPSSLALNPAGRSRWSSARERRGCQAAAMPVPTSPSRSLAPSASIRHGPPEPPPHRQHARTVITAKATHQRTRRSPGGVGASERPCEAPGRPERAWRGHHRRPADRALRRGRRGRRSGATSTSSRSGCGWPAGLVTENNAGCGAPGPAAVEVEQEKAHRNW